MKSRSLAVVLVLGAVALAHGDDPAKPPVPPPPGPAGPAAPPAPPPDPAKEQLFQDKAAEDALAMMAKGDITNVMEGLDRLSKLHSGKVTGQVIDFALSRTERHVAEFAGFALSCADPQGTLKEMSARLAGPKAIKNEQLEQMASLLAEVPAAEADKLLAHDRLLRSGDESVRREAIRGLGWHRSTLGIDNTVAALGSKDAAMRNVACVALGRIGDKRAVPGLLGVLDERDGGTGGFAAIALGRIEDASIFPEVAARLSGGGSPIDKAKALVATARAQNVDKLVSLVKSGGSDGKIAACAALGKLRLQTIEVQKQLFEAMVGDSDRWVRCAAFAALGQCATPEIAKTLGSRMGQQDDEKLRYMYEIAGDVAAKECVGPIQDAMWAAKTDLMRRIAADAFWRIHDGPAVAETEKKIREATGRNFERAMDILGLRRNRNGFDMALDLLGTTKGRDQILVHTALERQTGHFYGLDPKVWQSWIEKNPKYFEKEQDLVERAKWREEFLKENSAAGVAPTTEQSVQMALDYLARHQSPDGRFDQQTFLKLCGDPACPKTAGARIQHPDIGMTSLCALAYFGAGCGPSKGRYRGVLTRAMEYLLSRQMPDGDYEKNDLIGGYHRALVLQAYSEAAAASIESQEYLPFVQRGVDFLANIQADKAGWRYRVVDNANDTSVVAWVLFASKAAEKAHAKVRRSIYEGADIVMLHDQTRPTPEKDVEDLIVNFDPHYAFDPGRGHEHLEYWTGYQDDKFVANRATTAIGLMSRILLGCRRSHPFCIGSANTILTRQLPKMQPKKPGDWTAFNVDFQFPMYTLYYCTLSMHQMGGHYFAEWDKTLRDLLPSTQSKTGCERGSWESWGLDRDFSRLYTTAMGALTLETYYRYAPVLQD